MDVKCVVTLIFGLCFGTHLIEGYFFGAKPEENNYNAIPGSGYQPPSYISYQKPEKPIGYLQIGPENSSNNYQSPKPPSDLRYRLRPAPGIGSQDINLPQKPTILYINAPYPNNEQQYLNSPTYNQPSKPVDEPKRGFWDYFSFIIWPKWLFGSSNTEQENQYAYYSQAGPAYPPRPYSSSSFSSGQHLASSSNAYRPKPPLPPPPPPPHYSPTHQQGLYQVPAPNSKYPHVPQAVKYPNSGYQSPIFPKQSNDKVNQYQITSKAYTSATQLPTTRYPISSLTEIIKSQQPYTTTKSPVPIPPIYGPPDQSPFIPSQPAYSIYLVPSKPVQPPQGSNYQYNDPSQINRNPFGQHYRGVQGYGTYSDPSSLYNGYDYPTGVRPPVYNAPPTMQQQDSVYSPSVMALPHNPIYLNHQATPKPDCDHVKKTSIPPTNTHLRTPNDNTKALVIEIITSNVTESLINTTEDLQNSTSSLSSLPTSSTTAPSTIANVVS